MELEIFFRVLNMALILVWFYYMRYLYTWWASRPREERLVLVTIPLLMLVILFSTGESLAQHVGFGARVLLFTPILILCIFSSFKMTKKVKKVNREEDANE